MLVGYRSERSRLVDLVTSASDGDGGAVVLAGDAGVGKSSLCAEVAASAASTAIVLRASGVEQETAIAFAALHQLLVPLEGRIHELPGPQAESLQAALALGSSSAGDRLALGAAVHSLLTSVGSHVVVVVDDLQWVDPSTRSALLFAARRLEATSVAMVISTRRDDRQEPEDLRGLPVMRLTGLEPGEVASLLSDRGHEVAPGVVDALWRETGGNPLALLEAARALSTAVLAGIEPLPQPLPVGPALQEHYGARIDVLPERVGQALLLAAAGQRALEVLSTALEAAGLGFDELQVAEEEGLVEIAAGSVRFTHPLIRGAAYHGRQPHERRRAHRLLAEADPDPDRRAWHTAHAATGHDDDAATALRETAGRALARGGSPEAATSLQVAARLSSEPGTRLEVRIEAARCWHVAGLPARALSALDAAESDANAPVERAQLQEARATIELWLGNPRAARDLLELEADRIAASAPELATRLRILASMPSTMIAEVERSHRLAERACHDVDGGRLGWWSDAALGAAKLLLGQYDTGRELVEQATATALTDDVEVLSLQPDALPAAFFLVQGLWLAEEWQSAEELVTRIIQQARRHRAPALLTLPLALLADVHLRTGRLQEARAEASEAVDLSRAVGHVTELCHALALLALAGSKLGDPATRTYAAEVLALVEQTGAASMGAYAHQSLGALAVAEGRFDDAIVELRMAGHVTRSHGVVHPGVVPWASDLVEALVAAARADDAADVAHDHREQAQALATPMSLGVAERCRGLLGGDDAEDALRRSLAILPIERSPFEGARTALALGELLRRDHRRREARAHLSDAAVTFARLGAERWAERCREELRAAGGRSSATTARSLHDLSPQELRIALRVAAGETNREVAAALYISPKTVENTLTSIYAKLAVRSRTELAGLMATTGGAEPSPRRIRHGARTTDVG